MSDPDGPRAPIQELVAKLHQREGRDVVLMDARQVVVADSDPSGIGSVFTEDPGDEVGLTIKDGKARTFVETSDDYPTGIMEMVVPVETAKGQVTGAVVLEYTPLYHDMMALTAVTVPQIIGMGLVSAALAVLFALYLGRSIGAPVQQLTDAAKGFAAGRTDLPMPAFRTDEIGELVTAFTSMMESREKAEEELRESRDKLESRVIERTTELAGANSFLQQEFDRRSVAEKSVRELQRHQELVFNSITEGVHWIGHDGKIIFENPASARMLGWEASELIGQAAHSVMHHTRPDGSKYPYGECPIYSALQTGLACRVEEDLFWRKDGTSFPVEYTVTPMWDGVGNHVGVVVLYADITERKRSKALLNQKASLLRIAGKVTRTGGWSLDLSDGHVSWADEVFDILEYPPGHLTKVGDRLAVYPDPVRLRIAAAMDACKRDGTAFDLEVEILTVKNRRIWVRVCGEAERHADGSIQRVQGAFQDITERRQAAENLAANQDLLRQFIRHTPAAIAMLDNDMRYVQTSERWIQDYHLTGQEIIGKSHYEIFPDVPEAWKALHQRVLAGAVERCDEDLFPRADGSVDWLQWEARPWLDAGGGIGGLIFFTQVITERKRAEEELRWKTALLEAQVDSYAVGILVVDGNGKKILQNQRMTDLWKIPPEVAADSDDSRQVQFVLGSTKFPDLFVEKVIHLYAHPEECSVDEIELADGTVLDRYSAPVMGKNGHYYGRIWTFIDITERKRTEAETENLNQQLLELSRQAGMAEVATSVIHNVGNVLNSVNVSCSVIAEKVRRSRIASVGKTAELLRAHADGLPEFFASDPMGQKLPDFLEKLASRLNEEQASVLAEIQSLNRNIEHIKDIVSMQQSYAKVSTVAVMETVQVIDLVEDSLHINIGDLSRRDICVVRDYEKVPPVTVEKHKVLQILVNLIRNAKHSCDESGKSEKQITMRVTVDHGRIRITVIDNGSGILPEHLTRIFAHGFTTRKNGHGFGLHSAVIAAQGMGGDLTAHSDGLGKGATFTLELPVSIART
ncbi:MAG: PAS domain S-box protein [Luteolibacter sp.]